MVSVQQTSCYNLIFPSLKYINHMFTLSTKVTLIRGAHVQAHKAAHCFCALSGGRHACAKHINPPRRECSRKHSVTQAVNYLVHTTATVCRTEGLHMCPGVCVCSIFLWHPSLQVHCSGFHPSTGWVVSSLFMY